MSQPPLRPGKETEVKKCPQGHMDEVGQSWIELRLLGLVQAFRSVPSARWGLCQDPGYGPASQDVPAYVQAPLLHSKS